METKSKIKEIIVYSTPPCPYCKMAKQLLSEKGIEYSEVDVSTQDGLKAMQTKGDFRTVPQIFIGEEHIGGYDELSKLNNEGRLDDMLKE
ncbi:glutaredoxin 3 [Patescibacteria group bacterium]